MYCLIVLPIFSSVWRMKRSDQYVICYVETHTDDSQ
jgi:hypothetical protein